MIEAIEIFRHNALEIQARQLARREAEEQRAQKRRDEMADLAAEFEGSVKQIAAQLVEAVTAVRNNAETMAKAAEDQIWLDRASRRQYPRECRDGGAGSKRAVADDR